MNHAIEVRKLSKSYGGKIVVDDLSFVVEPGVVTGFLGPNGAGKSTTMRLIVGLDHPNHGNAYVGGIEYARLGQPLRAVGTLLDSDAVHPGRSAYNHLLYLVQTQAMPRTRVDEILEFVGLRDVAGERVGSYSLGMRKRLGIAAALLGNPPILILDEPINGLDPDGIVWIRNLMKGFASEGRTVFVSSHLMSEMARTADHLIVIDRGKLIAECTTRELIARTSETLVRVKCADPSALSRRITTAGGRTDPIDRETLSVRRLSARRIGELAQEQSITLYELTPQEASLEDAFMALTHSVPAEQEPSLVPLTVEGVP